MGNFIRSVLSAASAILQSKTVTPTQSQQNVTPDAGYDGLSQVTVDPIPSEYVIPSVITPSNSSPVSMASGSAYKPSANGYAIESYASVTPSASGTYFSSGMKNMSSSGYAYSSQPASSNVFTGSTVLSTTTTTTVYLGWKPKYIACLVYNGNDTATPPSPRAMMIYDADWSTRFYVRADASTELRFPTVPSTRTDAFYITAISDTGFTVTKSDNSSYRRMAFFAIG